MPKPPRIVKSNGESEPFRVGKLRRSLERAGADAARIRHVVGVVKDQLEDGMTTRALYRLAFRELKRETHGKDAAPARYNTKAAIQELGPSGYPFERFVAALFEAEGGRTETSVHLEGQFVGHEIDVVVGTGAERQLCECKLRTQADGKVDVKVAMYIYGRATDLRATRGGYDRFWLITNGRFTSDAIAFGEGMGLCMLGWSHPFGAGIEDRIEAAGVHPVTALTTLKSYEKRKLIRAGTVLARHVLDGPGLQPLERGARHGISEQRRARIEAEVRGLLHRDR